MAEFKIEVPIDVKNSNSGNSSGGGGPSFAKLTGAVAAGSLASKGLSVVMEGLMKTLEPLINVLKALFVVVFLPLMPLIMSLTEALALLIDGMAKLFGGEINIVEFIKSYLGPVLGQIGMAFIQLGMDIADAMIQIGEDLGQWLYDGVIVPVADAITSALMWVADGITAAILWAVNAIKNAFNFIVGLGKWIWDTIKAGLEFIGDLGSKIWEWFKGILSSIGDGLKSIVNGMIRILNKVPFVNVKQITDGVVSPGGQVVSVAPDDWLIATKDPKSLGGGGDTINISVSGNSFKNENDMRKMVDMISKELQRKGNRSFS